MVHMKPGCCPGMRRGPRLTDEGHGLPCRSAGQGAFHATTTQVPFQPVAPRRPVKRGDQCWRLACICAQKRWHFSCSVPGPHNNCTTRAGNSV